MKVVIVGAELCGGSPALSVPEKEREDRRILDLAGGGLRSTVRLAKSFASTLPPILLRNKYNVPDVLSEHIRQFQILRRMIVPAAEGLTGAIRCTDTIRRIVP